MFSKFSQVCALALSLFSIAAPDEAKALDSKLIKQMYLPSIGAATDFCAAYVKGKKPTVDQLKKANFEIRKAKETLVKARYNSHPKVEVYAKKWLGNLPCTVEVHQGQAEAVQTLVIWAQSRGHIISHFGYGKMDLQLSGGEKLSIRLIEISGNRIRGARFEFR